MEALDATAEGMMSAAVRLNDLADEDGCDEFMAATFRGLAVSYFNRACQMMAPATGQDAVAAASVSGDTPP